MCEKVKQLRAAVKVYRELATWKGLARSRDKGSSLGAVRAARNEPTDPCQSTAAQALACSKPIVDCTCTWTCGSQNGPSPVASIAFRVARHIASFQIRPFRRAIVSRMDGGNCSNRPVMT